MADAHLHRDEYKFVVVYFVPQLAATMQSLKCLHPIATMIDSGRTAHAIASGWTMIVCHESCITASRWRCLQMIDNHTQGENELLNVHSTKKGL